MAIRKSGLGPKGKGKGLDALFESEMASEPAFSKDKVVMIDINQIEPNKNQPRKQFQEESLEELASSIKQYGVIQPVVVKKNDDCYEIVAGERRWRASKIAGLTEIPSIIKDYEDKQLFEIALAENLQREDLNPMEEASGYKKLCDDFNLSQEELAAKVGKSRSAVANVLRLLNLDERVQELVRCGKLSAGHARTLLSITDGDTQFEFAERIIEEEMSVRQAEDTIKRFLEKKPKEKRTSKFNTENYKTIEDSLKNIFGTKVKLKSQTNKGKIEIEYYSDADLERLMSLISGIKG
ncbi:MAG: ParB/RepB/Spo0J family partition protein [Clostridia bacterium]|nr:ParB/RepB/Spo0J family partition protein [Clostridia bacterium]MCI1999422.1 ParB/RepB/Spo0J family partition protein [Clostridia bacterium]MCI2015076.1 ParB/RepB/Spo0J family partition protein [Clostridia bacterium]